MRLSGLPQNDTDLTLIQSLISGGAIDNFVLAGPGVAYVTFTSGSACDKFCDRYPNGLTFKQQGKSYVVFVDKGKDVDVISGVLQGYIDCGASRCVRAIGADDDWGMRALQKLAEGKTRKGKVESIIDSYRNEVSASQAKKKLFASSMILSKPLQTVPSLESPMLTLYPRFVLSSSGSPTYQMP